MTTTQNPMREPITNLKRLMFTGKTIAKPYRLIIFNDATEPNKKNNDDHYYDGNLEFNLILPITINKGV